MSMVEKLNQTKKGSGAGVGEVGGRWEHLPQILNQIFGPDPSCTHSFLGSQTPSCEGTGRGGIFEWYSWVTFRWDQNPGHRRKGESQKKKSIFWWKQPLNSWFLVLFYLQDFHFWKENLKKIIIKSWRGLSWWLRGKESTCQCRRHGFQPWLGKTPHAAEQLSLCTTVIEPVL